MGYVYCIELDIGVVKIGKSINPTNRIKEIVRHNYTNNCKTFISNNILNHTRLELDVHKHFDYCRVSGSEKFKVNFDDAVNIIKNYQDNKSIYDCKQNIQSKNNASQSESTNIAKMIWLNHFCNINNKFIEYYTKNFLINDICFSDEPIYECGELFSDVDKYDDNVFTLNFHMKHFVKNILKISDISDEEISILDIDSMINTLKNKYKHIQITNSASTEEENQLNN